MHVVEQEAVANTRDVIAAHRTPSLSRRLFAVARDAVNAWIDDYAPSMGAALAYYTLFSIAPTLLIVISVLGLLFGDDIGRTQIIDQLRMLMGNDGAAAVEGLLSSMNKPASGIGGTLIGFGVLVVGATTVFGELQNALDRIWRAPPPQGSGLWNLIRARLLSFGMVLATGFLLIVSLVLSAALAAIGHWSEPVFGGWTVLAQAVNTLVSFLVTTLAFTLIYKFIPRVSVPWSDVWVGATVTSVLFSIGKLLIGLYLGKSGVVSGFGAASSVVVLLVWVYYSAQIFLLGAEFTWVWSHTFGSKKHRVAPVPGRPRPSRLPQAARSG